MLVLRQQGPSPRVHCPLSFMRPCMCAVRVPTLPPALPAPCLPPSLRPPHPPTTPRHRCACCCFTGFVRGHQRGRLHLGCSPGACCREQTGAQVREAHLPVGPACTDCRRSVGLACCAQTCSGGPPSLLIPGFPASPPPPPPPPAGGACVGRQQRAAAAVADGAPKQGHRGGLQPGGRKCGCHLRCRPHNQGKQRAAHQRVPASSAARLFAPALRAAHQVLYAAAASMAAQLCAAAGSRPAQLSGTAWDCTFACTRAPLAPSQPVTQGAAARPTLSLAAVGPGERLRCAHAHAPQHLQHAGALFRWVPAWLLGTGGCSSHRG